MDWKSADYSLLFKLPEKGYTAFNDKRLVIEGWTTETIPQIVKP